MRRSSAPSQLSNRTNKFAPPFKKCNSSELKMEDLPIGLSQTHSAVASVQEEEVTFKHYKKRSSADLCAMIKNKLCSDSCIKQNENGKSHDSLLKDLNLDVENITSDNKLLKYSTVQANCDFSDISLIERNFLPESSLNNLSNSGDTSNEDRYYSVVWCKLSKKKHKKWEGDAVLTVKGRSVILKDSDGKDIGRSSGYKLKDLESLEEGNRLPIGGKEVEIQGKILKENYINGKCFREDICHSNNELPDIAASISSETKFKPFRLPMMGILTNKQIKASSTSLFNASNIDAIVMPRPTSSHQWAHNDRSLPVTDVVIDPHIGMKLRPHQRAGVIFLYECVMGFRLKEFEGTILADEMGLGKTLQCITLIWTLLKQGPYGCTPNIQKVLIVTPSSICANWGKEFDKWLGKERIQTFIVDQQNKVHDFIKQNISPILIISYELLVRNIDKLKPVTFDLLLCDEGHRLKNGNIKTTILLAELCIRKRIIITGTPIQNDLQELFSLVEFVNPGILGSYNMFKNIFMEPIINSQQPKASYEEKQIGESRASELNRITSQFTLRRTQEIINRYLPPKSEYVIFCQPSQIQSEVYQTVVGCNGLKKCLFESEVGEHLAAICMLRKLCNHPTLLYAYEKRYNLSDVQKEIINLLPSSANKHEFLEQDSGKLAFVSCLLWSISEFKRERIVIVSNFTTTLDMLQLLCQRYNYDFLRLDGSTPTAKRQNLVDKFNRKDCKEFVFLLSSKAGGVGLNLIGASRIILFDIDWNPATDLQAMARVWRDGQRRTVYIYRLLLSGSIEEKMYQRQVCKQGISGSVIDARNNSNVKFSIEELKDLFKFYPNTACLTHDALKCECDQIGGRPHLESLPSSQCEDRNNLLSDNLSQLKMATMDQLRSWQHFNMSKEIETLGDPYLESAGDFINFVFRCQSN